MAEDPAERILDEDDQGDVEQALQFVQSKWREIGTQLHIRAGTLNNYRQLDPEGATGKMVEDYLGGNYNTERFGPPTWKKIIEAVEKPSGGKNAAEAKRIADTYANKVKVKSSYATARTVTDKLLPKPEIKPYTETQVVHFPHSKGKRIVQVDGSNSKISFEQYDQWPEGDRLKEVEMSFGAVKPQEGDKKKSVAGAYEMTKWPHGVCVIINNEEFSKHTNREGTNLDEGNMVETFCHLGYLVEVHRDCNKEKIVDIFDEVRNRDHSQYDSFVCCIMSHGKAGHIFGSDSEMIPLDSITNMLKGVKCKTLASKPKLFFMQACRGTDKDKAVRVANDGDEDGATAMSADSERVASDSGGETIPDAADFFFSYATPLNQVAWRDLDNGSWFVAELCTSLSSYGSFASLVDMVTRTNGQVAEKYAVKGFKQEPDFNSRLRKDVFFF